jgi:hypothetical protein
MSENVEAKARRYLAEDRLHVERVEGDVVLARFLGDEGDTYKVRWDDARRA